MKKLTVKKKLRKGDEVFTYLAQRILNQSHIHHHYQLVEEDGEPCTTLAAVEARLKALVLQEKPRTKQNCNVTVVSTLCIKNKCPNANNVQIKILGDIIRIKKNGSVPSRVWCNFCKHYELFDDIISKIFEKHPDKHFMLLHPITKAHCTNDADIMTALYAYKALQPKTNPTQLKVFAKSTHVTEGGCTCTEFIKEYRIDHIAFNFSDGPTTRVWNKECAKSTISANAKAIRPKGQHTVGNIESTRQTMLAQIEQLAALSIDNIQQYRVYDVLIRKASDTLGAVVQLASGIRGKNGGSANLGKTTAKVIKVLESNALFIGQEMSRDGKFLRILVLPPSTLPLFKDIKSKYLYFNSPIVKKFKEFVFECKQPEQMHKMAELIEAHIADPASLRMNIRTANAHIDSFNIFLEHIGIEAILKNHYSDKTAGISILDSCQGDFLAFRKLNEVKTLRLICNLYNTNIKPMPGVYNLL